jgi:BMFP domain-containing protein YqiC
LGKGTAILYAGRTIAASPALVKAAPLPYISGHSKTRERRAMNQNNRIFDGLGRVMNEAAGVADGVRREVETVVKSQAQRIVNDMELVKREDFDALRELVQVQGEEIDALRKEILELRGSAAAKL